ncbi:helix-turn-helix domain-containing protein [Frondihabitans australicus]|uniref:Regulatory LuxR family protein n=1 Tax=Frondihabitans australicus TaxID=386892 RepID=A0A495IKI8_9MICO|nr:helix-turn-helix transcriptional regulator [Frondihabitans australicus]RKR75801.1 regulatory LuxR family protein [Frondihabitans australicus]
MSETSGTGRWRVSPRQVDILVLLSQGDAYKAIARKLNLSPATVAYHVGRMQQAVQARSVPALIARAFLLGVLTAELLPMLGVDDLPLDGT